MSIAKKVMSMYTDPTHLKVTDPGRIEGNTVFAYLDVFDPRVLEVEELKAHYQRGGLGDVVLKKRLIEVLEGVIAPIRESASSLKKIKAAVLEIVKQGTERTREAAEITMKEIRHAMKLDYFG